MAKQDRITHERLIRIVNYDPLTGIFTRPPSPRHLGTNNGSGYLIFSVDGRLYLAHRLAWLYVTGEWPIKLIDHINRDKSDNRIINLRLSDKSLNGHNASLSKRNSTGLSGATRQSNTRRFRACIVKDRKRLHLGYFDTPEEANAAYLEAKRKVCPLL